MTQRGKYVVLEGPDGCGKTTHSRLLVDDLNSRQIPCYLLREPGGTRTGELVRTLLLDKDLKMFALAELFLFEGQRAQVFEEVVIPNLEKGVVVVSDRSGYSTEAYQGYGRGLNLDLIRQLNAAATFGVVPDLTLMIKTPRGIGTERATVKARFEVEDPAFHRRVKRGYAEIAKRDSHLITTIKYRDGDVEGMQQEIQRYVDGVFML